MGKATDTLIGIGGAMLLILAVVMSLNNKTTSTSNGTDTSNVSVPATAPYTPPTTTIQTPETTLPATSAQTTTPATTKSPETTPETATAPLEWTENAVSGTMYVNQSCYSRTRAIMGSDTVRGYSYGDVVTVVAVTDSGYYK